MSTLFARAGAELSAFNDTLSVGGDLDMAVAAEIAAAGRRWLAAQRPAAVTFDLSAVDKANSVALSVLLEWLRGCREHAIPLSYIALSPALERLARLSGLDALISDPAAALSTSV
ncbi:STAS domain-containing protein [Halomonas dongshanensis]|uniref:STAS domain-containing protein n=1 Tax=Halomonas dongshanensis TaxID=2890835 RepID=A0ABT2EF77_9GAMM|nr:STAS domain-containing protein [Halomonas dongshanensis]